ncbi:MULTISPECIES: FRG domain-containing protein [unclassified Pseudoalteromonas]|uniref:FRG domain-containing protein n=1 Tax=unclassified Pseudoalteromonas TaxID=194690 RepID=UPI000C069CDF|nr:MULTISPECIES: FRG domain-containing protein [unclassified Pseudoalteromonas]MDP2636747.1 FRG domain-containing protein [Pseudoalteromonas sp. 1_MG-2023]PHN88232.1 FRG domain-containing protein [Pseudoalteromonas sp. 3D05]
MRNNWDDFKTWVGSHINLGKKYYFRGQSNHTWKLATTYHRNIVGKNITMHHYLTSIMKDVNYQISSFNKPINLSDSQEFGHLLAKLQHHGFPTPLLDWTLSPYVAAFFAFKGVPVSSEPDHKVSIYILDIDLWVKMFPSQNDLLGKTEFLSDFVPFVTDNPRMSRQMGVTTSTNVADLESFILTNARAANRELLWKFDMPANERGRVMKELNLMGINDMTMFPDFDGLCSYLKEVHFNNIQKQLPIPPPVTPPPV